ncbi:MAG: HD domain-containing phosphohydrolase, partial [Gemmatimonadaceae bacterium]
MLSDPPRTLLSSTPSLDALVDQGRLAEGRGQFVAARELYERALHSLPSDADPALVAALFVDIARTQLGSRNQTAAADALDAVFALPRQSGMEGALAAAVEMRGRLQWLDGRLEQAAADFGDARERALRAGNRSLAAHSAAQSGALAAVRGDVDLAVQHYELAADESRAIEDQETLADALAQLSALFSGLRRWNSAEQAFAEAVQLAQARGDERALATLEVGRGEMALARANVERARASAERAVDFARRSEDPDVLTRAITLSGIVWRELGDYARSEPLLELAERQANTRNDLLAIAEVARERADLHARQDRHAQTLASLNRAYRALTQLRARGADAATARRMTRVEDGFLDVVARWAQRIEGKDNATEGHCTRVSDLTCEIARRMGVDRAALFWYRVGALLHDIGKIEVPASILNKVGRLTAEEWTVVKRHPTTGVELLAQVDFPWEVRPIVESHHECWDGSGYPHGLAGEEIPLAARIFHV